MSEYLYHINAKHEVCEVPATRDRLMATSPIFHSTRRKALMAACEQIHKAVTELEKLRSQHQRELVKG